MINSDNRYDFGKDPLGVRYTGSKPRVLLQATIHTLAELFNIHRVSLDRWIKAKLLNSNDLKSICEFYCQRKLKKELQDILPKFLKELRKDNQDVKGALLEVLRDRIPQ